LARKDGLLIENREHRRFFSLPSFVAAAASAIFALASLAFATPAQASHHHHHSASAHRYSKPAHSKRVSKSKPHHQHHAEKSRKHTASAHEKRLAKLHARHLAALHAAHLHRLARIHARAEARFQASLKHMSPRMRVIAIQNHAIHSGSVVQAAEAFRGTRYRFGGTSRSGFDCSGFTRYILSRTAGVALPRTASEQYEHGKPVCNLKAGDLVFFKNTYKHGVSHVGIYIGDGKFAHAANSHKGVVVEPLSSPYYARHFVGARRVVHHR
jgi:cell wall-associated NlpC family hydrolase